MLRSKKIFLWSPRATDINPKELHAVITPLYVRKTHRCFPRDSSPSTMMSLLGRLFGDIIVRSDIIVYIVKLTGLCRQKGKYNCAFKYPQFATFSHSNGENMSKIILLQRSINTTFIGNKYYIYTNFVVMLRGHEM